MEVTRENIEHQIQRAINYLTQIEVNPEEKALISQDMGTISTYFSWLSEHILEIPDGGTYEGLNTQLHGLPLPARPNFTLPSVTPGVYPYGTQLHNAVGTGTYSGMSSAGALMTGSSELRDFLIYGSGADAIKGDWGDIIVRRGHIFALGLIATAHADGFQSRGGLNSCLFEDVFMDIPTNEDLGTTKSNACFIVDSSLGRHNGDITINRNILRGGNRVFMLGDKGTGNRFPDFYVNNTAIVVELDSPRYTILQPGLEQHFHFDDNSAIYSQENGICSFVTNDILQFNMDLWHRETHGRRTLR